MASNPRSANAGLCVLRKLPNLAEPAMEERVMEPDSESCGRLGGESCEHRSPAGKCLVNTIASALISATSTHSEGPLL